MSMHWTSQSTKDFVYRISSDFVLQIEKKMDEKTINQSELADRLQVTPGRVSQVLRNPGNMTLKNMVEYARGLGMKVAVVAYDDGDPENHNGPINSQIFSSCWENAGQPTDFFSLTASTSVIRIASPIIHFVASSQFTDEKDTLDMQFCDADFSNLVWETKKATAKSFTRVGAQ